MSSHSNSELIADVVEVIMLTRKESAIAQGKLVDYLEPWGFSSGSIALGVQAMAKRSQLLGPAYPFTVTDAAVGRSATPELSTYGALVLMSGIKNLPLPKKLLPAATTCFEFIVEDCLTTFYGPETQSLRFGFPSERGRPPGFSDSVKWLAQQLGITHGDVYRDPRRKDGGLDLIAWRPFPDGRDGFPILLVQATLEEKYMHKANDVNARLWGLLLGLDTDPATALAIPRAVSNLEHWREVSTKTVILDRNRLAHLHSSAPCLGTEKPAKVVTDLLAARKTDLRDMGVPY